MVGDVKDGIFSVFKDIINVGSSQLKDKRHKKKGITIEIEPDLIKDQLFKKPEALKKILNKFSNKTFIIKQENDETNYEVSVKIEICDIFEYILNMREDFLIDNAIEFFREKFYNEIFKMDESEWNNAKINQNILTLLPNSLQEVGKQMKKDDDNEEEEDEEKPRFKNYNENEEFKSFDMILKRSFIEIIMFAFYFTNNADLQNAIFKLLHSCCTEKDRMCKSITKLEILFTTEDQNLHQKLSNLLLKLKNLISNSQVSEIAEYFS